MNGQESWQEGNTRYLSMALLWLRACLESCAGQPQQEQLPLPLAPPPAPVPSRSIWKQFLQRGAAPAPKMPNLLPPPALLILAQRLGLSQFEQQVLLLCAGVELDGGIAPLCAACQHEPARF